MTLSGTVEQFPQAPNGDGTFQQGPTVAAGMLPAAIAAGDFDFDGRVDLVTDNRDATVRVLLATGVPSFSEIGIYRPTSTASNSTMEFYLESRGRNSYFPDDKTSLFGVSGIPELTLTDVAVAGDWDGTGVIRFGVFHCPSSPAVYPCTWFIDLNNSGAWEGVAGGDAAWANFGLAGDMPVVGDWTGDGKSKIGVKRPASTSRIRGSTSLQSIGWEFRRRRSLTNRRTPGMHGPLPPLACE